MTAAQRLGLWANIPRLEAEDELRRRRAESKLTADRLYDLTLLSTGGDEAAAQRAFSAFRSAELSAGITPEA